MRRTISYLLFIIVFILSACSRPSPSAGEELPPLTARMSDLQGTVQIRTSGSEVLQEAGSQTLQENDQILTGEDGRVRLDLSTGAIIRIASSTVFTLTGISNQADGVNANLKVDIGRIWIILQGGSVDVETPSGVASVRGSYLMVTVAPSGEVLLTCLEGDCRFTNESGEHILAEGDIAVIKNAQVPPLMEQMTAEQVEEWLSENPEAVLVIPSLAWYASPTPAVTWTATGTAAASSTPIATETITPLSTATTVYVPPKATSTQPPEEEDDAPTETSIPPTATAMPTATIPPTATVTPTATPIPQYSPTEGYTITNVNVNNGQSVSVGQQFTLSFDYVIWNGSSCPGCILQLVVGLDGVNQFCAYDGIPALNPPGTAGTANEMLIAPPSPGIYDISVFVVAEYTCNAALTYSVATSVITTVNVQSP
jgi:hypothetical protein